MANIVKRGRKLGVGDDVFSQNAWDDTEWTEEMLLEAERRIEEQKKEANLSEEEKSIRIATVEKNAQKNWNLFYGVHEDRFFKDRRWIFSEFPEILDCLKTDSKPCNILEVGCGVGNAVVEIINRNQNQNLHLFCCDIADSAIETLKGRDFYRQNQHKMTAFQMDICKAFESADCASFPIEPQSLDFVMLVFALSAMKPELMARTVENLAKFLKPGGMFLLRDYARYDMTQLRFKPKSYLSDNYYVRNDGTTSFFFTKQTLDDLFMSTRCLERIELKNDNRLLVNRLKSLKMCRCWIQAKYKKLP